jgi:hypothetical protein
MPAHYAAGQGPRDEADEEDQDDLHGLRLPRVHGSPDDVRRHDNPAECVGLYAAVAGRVNGSGKPGVSRSTEPSGSMAARELPPYSG